jgi:hypothetical protein
MHVIWRKGIISARINHYSISLLIIMGCETVYMAATTMLQYRWIIWLIEIKLGKKQ